MLKRFTFLFFILLVFNAQAQKKVKVDAERLETLNLISSSVSKLMDFRLMYEQVYTGHGLWIGMPLRSQELKVKVNLDYPLNKDHLREVAQQWPTAEDKLLLDSLLEKTELLVLEAKRVMEELSTYEHYEDPMVSFLADERFSSTVTVLKDEADYYYDKLISNLSRRKDFLQSNLSSKENRAKKFSDIQEFLMLTIDTDLLIQTIESQQLNQGYPVQLSSRSKALLKEKLIAKLIPIYDSRFSHKEIKALIQFQKSEVGKKIRSQQASIQLELLLAVQKWLNEYSQE